MTSRTPRQAVTSGAQPGRRWRSPEPPWFRLHPIARGGGPGLQHRARTFAPRILIGAALVLLGAAAGVATGHTMAKRTAHRTGACIALNMAAALGYLDAEQQRRVRHALVTAINPDADLFSGGRPSLGQTCSAGAGG